MRTQLLEETPIHQAATQLEEAISLLEGIVLSADCSPVVEKLESSLRGIRKERERLHHAVVSEDFETLLQIQIRLSRKLARAFRIYTSNFSV